MTHPEPSPADRWQFALMVLRERRLDLACIGQAPQHHRDRRLARLALDMATQRAAKAYRAMLGVSA